MQFFFRGLLVAAITYFLKLGHNNHGLIFTVVTLGLLRAVETMGLLWAVSSMGLRRAVLSIGQTWAKNRPHYGRKWARVEIVRSWADHNGLTITGHR